FAAIPPQSQSFPTFAGQTDAKLAPSQIRPRSWAATPLPTPSPLAKLLQNGDRCVSSVLAAPQSAAISSPGFPTSNYRCSERCHHGGLGRFVCALFHEHRSGNQIKNDPQKPHGFLAAGSIATAVGRSPL